MIRSLLAPNPRSGRALRIGNELEATLPVLAFVGLAALLYGARLPRARVDVRLGRPALGAAIGAGRLGADVGGVITVGAGTAVAVLLMLPGG